MATGRHEQPPEDEGSTPGATEPITLTDPDGAVTLVAPWSTWTREQMRAPGGEPALVTRLEQGQLWFSAGRRRSPWRHEVHIGRVVVSTPMGRFQMLARTMPVMSNAAARTISTTTRNRRFGRGEGVFCASVMPGYSRR